MAYNSDQQSAEVTPRHEFLKATHTSRRSLVFVQTVLPSLISHVFHALVPDLLVALQPSFNFECRGGFRKKARDAHGVFDRHCAALAQDWDLVSCVTTVWKDSASYKVRTDELHRRSRLSVLESRTAGIACRTAPRL